jgi:Bacterial mobilisation protein (MobC)
MEEASGFSFAYLVRRALFNAPAPPSRHRPSVDHEAVAKLLGALGKIGGNVNQIAKLANMGRSELDIPELKMALRGLAELRLVCLQALGYEPRPENPTRRRP